MASCIIITFNVSSRDMGVKVRACHDFAHLFERFGWELFGQLSHLAAQDLARGGLGDCFDAVR